MALIIRKSYFGMYTMVFWFPWQPDFFSPFFPPTQTKCDVVPTEFDATAATANLPLRTERLPRLQQRRSR